MKTLMALLLGLALLPLPGTARPWSGDQGSGDQDNKDKKEKKDKKKKDKKDQVTGDEPLPPPNPGATERDLTRLMRDIQFALEGNDARQFLSFFDSAKFDDYPRFEDMVERLTRQDTIRAHFRTAFTAPPTGAGKAQMTVDAEMELGRKDAVGQLQRRRQQLMIDFQYTRRGWRIINLTPRDYFQPL